MSGNGSGPLVPTFTGYVQTSMDGLMLFEACLSGKLHHVPRRPHDRERASLIKSGSIFIYEENASGIKRWTDGVAWSPSRILGNFLIYRELEKPFPPGEKKRAMKRKRSDVPDGEMPRRDSEEQDGPALHIPATPPSPPKVEESTDPKIPDAEREIDRQLVGSLVDSYGFRADGLVKKTMSISVQGVSHHLVSYYKPEDVKARKLLRPADDPRIANIPVRSELYMKQNFRTPLEESEHYMVDPNTRYAHPGAAYPPMMTGAYQMRPATYAPSGGYQMYTTPVSQAASTAPVYNPNHAHAWSSAQQQGIPSAYSNPSYSSQPYGDFYDNPRPMASASYGSSQQNAYPPQYSNTYPNTPGWKR